MKTSHFFLMGLALFFSACSFLKQAAPSPDVTVSITPDQLVEQPAHTSTTTPTLTPPPTPTPAPSLTPSPTMTPPSPALPPSFSSLKVVFAVDDQIWLWENGTSRPITKVEGYRVRISDDGSLIAFRRDDGLWVIGSDGSNARLLVSSDFFESIELEDRDVGLSQFDWIPGTHILWFNTRILGFGLYYTDDLYQVNADTRQLKMLRQPGEGGKFNFSPDGLRAVLVTPHKISVMNVDGSAFRSLLEYYVSTDSETYYYAQPVWGPDSQSLIVSIPTYPHFVNPEAPVSIWRLYLDTRPAELISQETMEDAGHWVWAPDFEHYATFSYADKRYYLGLNGETLEPLSEPTSPSWFTWIDETHYIFLENCSLKFGTIGAPSITVLDSNLYDDCLTDYDFIR